MNILRQVMVRAMKRAQIPEDRRDWLRPIHSFRDTFGTRLGQKGVTVQRIAKLMGNDISMASKYVDVSQGEMRDAVAAIEG